MNKLSCAFCVLALILLSVFLAFNPGFGGKTFKIESKWEEDEKELEIELEGTSVNNVSFKDISIVNPWSMEEVQGQFRYERDHDEIEIEIYSPSQIPCELLVVVSGTEHRVRLQHAPENCINQKAEKTQKTPETRESEVRQVTPAEKNVRSSLNGQPLCQSCHEQKKSRKIFSEAPHPPPHTQNCSTCHNI
ncbi:hypothetical protein [Desulfovermiculus halophilus]|uniref:hypothetical protein n=1 Tax=Desulfovermiculus halophilus TaxID=339722 RepID=UPI0012946D27|nr:hypothetical protein [Desulfovermiculus halophilus]